MGLPLPCQKQREYIDEIMWEFQMYFWMQLLAMGNIQIGP